MKQILLLILILPVFLNAQFEQLIESGDFNLKHNFFKEAESDYKKALQFEDVAKDQKQYVNLQLAKVYYKLFDYENAELQYQLIVNQSELSDEGSWLNYADILRNNGKYEEARIAYEKYASFSGKYSVSDLYTAACDWAIARKDSFANCNIFKTNLETGGRSFGTAYFKDGLIYSRSQSEEFDVKTTFYDVSYAAKDTGNDSLFQNAQSYKGELNKQFYEGSPSITQDKKMYYTGNASERTVYKERKRDKKNYQISSKGVNILKIYEVEWADTAWVNRKELPFCSNEYSCTHPAVSKDGKALYFVSDMEGGYGGFDLYVSYFVDSAWSTPKNLGPGVNTSANEMTPFLKGDTLYFSSKGLLGFGGADIFRAEIKQGAVLSLKNIGKPYNTSKDDFAFILSEDNQSGYLSSNRAGTHGYDHIYFFEKYEVVYPDTIQGVAMNRVTGLPIPGVKVTIEPDTLGASLSIQETDKGGEITIILPKNEEFLVTFWADGFEPLEVKVPAENREDLIALFGNLELIPEAKKDVVLEIDEIYFEYDKADIRPESKPALTKILEYLNYYPEIKVELSAHTDSRGSDSYNKRLSQKRAQSTVDYLVDHGIERSRLVPVGYGETKLRNHCKNGVKCSDEDHMFNRRVELKVL